METEARKMSLSIEGSFITNFAREKLYYNNDFDNAVEILLSCLQTNQISDIERLGFAIKILNGELKIKGTYPGDDYGIVEDETKTKTNKTISSHFRKLAEDLKKAQETIDNLSAKLNCISESLSNRELSYINMIWRRDYSGSEDDQSIFIEPDYHNYINIDSNKENDSEEQTSPESLLQSFLDNMKTGLDDDYGWLEPSGKFHPVEWCEHQEWAKKYLEENDPNFNEDDDYFSIWDYGEKLIEKGWILIHNPGRGIGQLSRDETRGFTKAQREFLYDYYTKRKKFETAKLYLEEEGEI